MIANASTCGRWPIRVIGVPRRDRDDEFDGLDENALIDASERLSKMDIVRAAGAFDGTLDASVALR